MIQCDYLFYRNVQLAKTCKKGWQFFFHELNPACSKDISYSIRSDKIPQPAAVVNHLFFLQVIIRTYHRIHVYLQSGSIFTHRGDAGILSILPLQYLVAKPVRYL